MTAVIPDPPPASDAVTIARIEGKIDLLIDNVARLHDDGKDHETRLRAIESSYVSKAAVLAWWGVLAAVLTIAEVGLGLVMRK